MIPKFPATVFFLSLFAPHSYQPQRQKITEDPSDLLRAKQTQVSCLSYYRYRSVITALYNFALLLLVSFKETQVCHILSPASRPHFLPFFVWP